MKGIQGLILALGLGVAGALLNWAYLTSKSQELEKIEFVGIKPDVTVDRGEKLLAEHLRPVGIPKDAVGNLKDFAVLYADLQTVIGRNVCRTITGGSLLLSEDLKTPPAELSFGQKAERGAEERAMWIPVDTKTFVPSLVNPGDMVSFLVARSPIRAPTRAPDRPAAAADDSEGSSSGSPAQPEAPAAAAGTTEIIGPFKILSLGNRLGTAEVLRANKIAQVQENVMTVSVKIVDGQLEPKAQRLWDLLRATNFQQVGILLHPRQTK